MALSRYLIGEILHLALETGRSKLNSLSFRLQSAIKDFATPHLTLRADTDNGYI
jgi:hypothetical protein